MKAGRNLLCSGPCSLHWFYPAGLRAVLAWRKGVLEGRGSWGAGACVAPGSSAWRALKGVLEGLGSWGAGACVAPGFSAWRALGLTSWWDRFVSEWHGCLVAHVALFHVVTIV